MRKVRTGSVEIIILMLAQSLYILSYKRNLLTSTHGLLGVYRQLSSLFGSATNR